MADESNESTQKKEESVGSTSRKAFVAAIISIALSPLSAMFGYFGAHVLQAPRLEVEADSADWTLENQKMNLAVMKRLKANDFVASRLRGALVGRPRDSGQSACIEWLDRDEWNDGCRQEIRDIVVVVQGELRSVIPALTYNLKALETNRDLKQISLQPVFIPGLESLEPLARRDRDAAIAMTRGHLELARRASRDLIPFVDELNRMDQTKAPYSGDVAFNVNVLNTGDGDGLVRKEARLLFGDSSEIPLMAERHTVTKSHSLETVTFSTDSSSTAPEAWNAWRILLNKPGKQDCVVVIRAGKKEIKLQYVHSN
jgi:hypothetical protein